MRETFGALQRRSETSSGRGRRVRSRTQYNQTTHAKLRLCSHARHAPTPHRSHRMRMCPYSARTPCVGGQARDIGRSSRGEVHRRERGQHALRAAVRVWRAAAARRLHRGRHARVGRHGWQARVLCQVGWECWERRQAGGGSWRCRRLCLRAVGERVRRQVERRASLGTRPLADGRGDKGPSEAERGARCRSQQ